MNDLANLRLWQLINPNLPIGSFAYSQGLEWAIEQGWVNSLSSLETWLSEQLEHNQAYLDLPLFIRLYQACAQQDKAAFQTWIDELLANRESAELYAEEQNRGRALAELLCQLAVPLAEDWKAELKQSQLAGFALASQQWQIPQEQALQAYLWSFLENQVIAAVKTIPLGQSQGQQLLQTLATHIPQITHSALTLSDADIGSSSPALAIASSRHEYQYTRLYRS